MEKTFWNVFHCQRKITTKDGIVYGKYCGNRSCMVCMSIRKAQMINKYYPILSLWEQPYFVTLTAKTCSAKGLPLRMKKMIKAFQLIHDKQRKRHKRGRGIRLASVRSLECNFNPERNWYNPHFHLIVETKEMADLLVNEWLKLWTPKFARRGAQKVLPVYNLTTNLIEIIKYSSKVFTEPGTKNKYQPKTNRRTPKIYVKALYNILCAMKGHRLFDRFGFNDPNPKQKPVGAKVVVDFEQWTYSLTKRDWIDNQTGEALTHYAPPPELLDLLLNHVDSERE